MADPSAPSDNEVFIYQQVKQRYDDERSRSKDDVDGRAAQLIGWTGLVISILFAGGGIFFTREGSTIQLTQLTPLELANILAIFTVLIVSLGLSLWAFKMWHYQVVPDARNLVNEYGNRSHRETLRRIVASMVTALEYNLDLNDRKSRLVGYSWALFFAGMILTAIFIYARKPQRSHRQMSEETKDKKGKVVKDASTDALAWEPDPNLVVELMDAKRHRRDKDTK